MFRRVVRTSLGEPGDRHKFEHAHESPPNMWVPLVILAGLSCSFWYSGWFGALARKPASAIPAVHALKGSPAGAHAVIPAPSREGRFGLATGLAHAGAPEAPRGGPGHGAP